MGTNFYDGLPFRHRSQQSKEVSRMESPMQMGDIGRVVLCSAQDCAYNQNTKCVADAVHVKLHSDHADCNTYTHNKHAGTMEQPGQMGQQY